MLCDSASEAETKIEPQQRSFVAEKRYFAVSCDRTSSLEKRLTQRSVSPSVSGFIFW